MTCELFPGVTGSAQGWDNKEIHNQPTAHPDHSANDVDLPKRYH